MPSLGKSEEHEEFASLFHNSRTSHIASGRHVGLELELIRSSLGKLASQRRSIKASENSPVANSFDECDVESARPLSPGVHSLLKDLESCLERAQQYGEPLTPSEPEFYSTQSIIVNKSCREHTPSFYSNTSSIMVDRTNSMLDYQNVYAGLTSAAKSSTRSPSSEITVNDTFVAAILVGWLEKLYITNPSFLARKSWKRRFFVLTPDVLYRFKSSQSTTVADEHLDIRADTIACVSDKFSGKKWVIEITNPGVSWYIQAECLDELKTWLSVLKSAIIRKKYSSSLLSSDGEPIHVDALGEFPLRSQTSHTSMIDSKSSVVLSLPRSSTHLPPQPPVPRGKPPQPPSCIY
ncbi:hypothetical protein K493DRAFT_319982 [Basidiobolus meristosporus CBS 931.73]|uniref:PH domain-containing protein n=1 Tax=Basidiobolus meristosporus CBS 931.73 TaxID=1314790 RepID=A0A1Y1XHR9_9FUNG|nr:hypothetical protein K493DRAFT_319982 [Basidiobolus meristosporus CBS 931.73]|eukprot:ORX85283.1 hypothetical protein K493DRAFT_319982 [Basidiobolus meristosporus CBS 931.73]